MKTLTIFKGVLILLLTSASLILNAQSIKELQEVIKRAEKEIALDTKLLNSAKKEHKLTLSQLKVVKSRINNRKTIINSLDKQARIIDRDIDKKNSTISDLNNDITTLKSEYAEMITTAYKNHKLNNYLLFLFASKDFNDATKRIAYMKRYNNMREIKAEQIEKLCMESESQIKDLNKKHIALSNTKVSRKRELTTLNKDESKYKSEAKSLQSRQSSINKKLRKQIADREKAQKKLQDIIAAEAKKNKNTKRSASEEKYALELSGRFDENIGKLPYPIREGIIVDKFGIHAHPTIKGLTVNNKGINIAGKSADPVYCVFEGTVSRIIFIQGLNNCIMVRHGNYITIYSNIASVNVKKDQKVTLNQVLGKLSNSSNSDDCILHFEIWKETKTLNPETCLRR